MNRKRRANEAILTTMDEIVLTADERAHVRDANRAAFEAHGLSRLDQFEPQMRAASRAGRLRRLDGSMLGVDDLPLHRAVRQGVTVREQFVLQTPAGSEIFMYATAVPLQSEERVTGGVVVARNITELMELDRLKDQFLAMAAHELKTPLAIIKGGLQSLAGRSKTPDAAKAAVDGALARIGRGADRIDQVVTDLLDVSQLQLGSFVIHREPVALRELARSTIAKATLLAPRHRVILRRGARVTVMADRRRISQVLANLLSNAVKFSPGGGDVEVEVIRTAHEAIMSVRDHGIGIPRQGQAHIFERFYRAHADTPDDRGGTGLGLYLSNEFIASHGGRMWFESAEGAGSTFSFSLPR